jgi:uncharacterized repeat protein (TIGR03943 family)
LRRSVATRWLGVGLASGLAVVTLALAATGRLALYISPSSNWFAIPMAILLLVGAVASFLLPLGAEDDHGHDHGDHDHDHHVPPARTVSDSVRVTASVTGGVVASGVVLSILLLPPASLSPDAVATRETGSAPLFSGSDLVSLATHGDTTAFGVGDWASVFATATNPGAFEGDTVTLTGFVSPGPGSGGFDLTRLVITHCVIDAQVARIPVASTTAAPDKGQWVTIIGTVRSTTDGTLEIDANKVTHIAEPKDPYEY